MRRKSPVQQWVDSIPQKEGDDRQEAVEDDSVSHLQRNISVDEKAKSKPKLVRSEATIEPDNDADVEEQYDSIGQIKPNESSDSISVDMNPSDDRVNRKSSKATLLRERSTNSEGNSPRTRHSFFRDSSFQSEGAGSRCSSVESLLESRKVDAEAVLRGVGFGPSPARQQLARIPDRFLKPSKVNGINTEDFIKEEQKSMKMHECGVFGYRGLTGNPHAPPSMIVAKIIERISSREDLPDTTCFIHHSDYDSY